MAATRQLASLKWPLASLEWPLASLNADAHREDVGVQHWPDHNLPNEVLRRLQPRDVIPRDAAAGIDDVIADLGNPKDHAGGDYTHQCLVMGGLWSAALHGACLAGGKCVVLAVPATSSAGAAERGCAHQ